MSTDTQIESEIQAKGLTAPRVTTADVEAEIAFEHYFTAAQGMRMRMAFEEGSLPAHDLKYGPLELLTFCVLVLKNGFTVTGESACASPENFDADIGRKIARTNAVNKIWPLLGFRLRDQFAYNPRTLHRDAATGKLVTEDYAAANPSTTVREVR